MHKDHLLNKLFTSIIVTIANGKDMVRLCLNAQCSLITTTWPTSYFYHFFDDKFVSLLTKRPIFLQNTSGNPRCRPRKYPLAVDLIICT